MRRDAACTACPGTGQLQFFEEAGVEAVVAGYGGEEVGLGNEFVFPGVLCEELGDLILVLGGEDGAGGVEELAAGLEHFGILDEELRLDGADAVEGGGLEAPFEVGLAFQGAEAGAGGVDEQGVGDVCEFGGGGFGDRLRGDLGGAGAFGALLEGGEFFLIDVHGEDAGFVVR